MMDYLYIPQTTTEWIILLIIAFGGIAILFTYLKFYLPAILHKDQWIEKDIPVSIIICARNEEENLRENLRYVLEQDYPNYEVIVVNDCSIDQTEQVIDEYYTQYPDKLRKVNVPESENYKHGKKMAVFIGIKHAKYEHLVFTDADCRPASKDWLKIMSSHFDNEKEIVLGYGKYKTEKSFFNRLIRYDTLIIALQYLSCALKGNAYMGVGRNLAYTKSLFFKNKGFANHYHLASGDDDLFVNETATATNTSVCTDKKAFTISEPPLIFKHWLLQKSRHISTYHLYKPQHKWMLGWIHFSIVFFYGSILLSLFMSPQLWVWIALLYLIKYLTHTTIVYYASKKFDEERLTTIAFILEPLLIISYIYITLYKRIKKL